MRADGVSGCTPRYSVPPAPGGESQQRPILQGKTDEDLRTFIVEALDKREPFYSQARYRFDAGYLESRSQISESVQRLRQLLGL